RRVAAARVACFRIFRAIFNRKDAERKRKCWESAGTRRTRKINHYTREHHPKSEMKPKCHSQQKNRQHENLTTGQKWMQERGESGEQGRRASIALHPTPQQRQAQCVQTPRALTSELLQKDPLDLCVCENVFENVLHLVLWAEHP
ncbi:unnamed protein product, partial [Ectocarpus sp. 12 AP-2014]